MSEAEQGWDTEREQDLPLNDYIPCQGDDKRKTQVYRCRRCGVQVARECDALQLLGNEREEVQFLKVRNVNLDGTCYRCGLDLGCERASENDNTLPLLLPDGQHAFVKTPYRVMVLLYCTQFEFITGKAVRDESGQLVIDDDGNMKRNLFAIPNSVNIINALRGPLFSSLAPGLDIEVKVELRGHNIYYNPDHHNFEKSVALFDTHFGPGVIEEMTTKTEIDLNKTVDLCLLLRARKEVKELVWTGYWGLKSEAELAQCWRASGGNVLFGNWGAPEASPDTVPDQATFVAEMRDEITRFSEGVKPGRRVREIHGEDYGAYEANNQLGLADLTERGHYLLWWSFDDSLPEGVKEKIISALIDGIYPRWQKLSDLPAPFFQPQAGYYGWGFDEEPPSPQPRPAFSFGEPSF